ncbi:uncharacterized protein LOC124312513 [Daphnia pulicaria]|uniref:uncharacterized protein LOC124312513 n=1 Tax=Daphnia pulicaria TaxID=35523 RepID=UPI001EEAF732|nr:uncharacterized protein LOC124312513 [Daphnia pulicaria]
MFLNTFANLVLMAMMLQFLIVETQLTSATPEQANNIGSVQLSTVCSNTVDSNMNLLFDKTSRLYPELNIFFSAVRNKGKKELDRSCTNSRGDFMEYQTAEVGNTEKTLVINHQMVIEKIKL